MKRTITIETPVLRRNSSNPDAPHSATEYEPGQSSFRAVLSDDLRRQGMGTVSGKAIGVSPRKKPESVSLLGFMARVFSSLRGRAVAPKQLRLLETVPLGEKCFVALVCAEGHKFLIGGGSTGVSLLTQLDPPPALENETTESDRSETAGLKPRDPQVITDRPKSYVELAGVAE